MRRMGTVLVPFHGNLVLLASSEPAVKRCLKEHCDMEVQGVQRYDKMQNWDSLDTDDVVHDEKTLDGLADVPRSSVEGNKAESPNQ